MLFCQISLVSLVCLCPDIYTSYQLAFALFCPPRYHQHLIALFCQATLSYKSGFSRNSRKGSQHLLYFAKYLVSRGISIDSSLSRYISTITMAEPVVSFLLEQLAVLLHEERHLLGGFEGEVEYIQREMRQMKAFLGVADAKEARDPTLKEWIGQVREISYDIQDILDKYMLRLTHRDTTGFSGLIMAVYASMKGLKARHQIASEIRAIRQRLEDISKSRERYREMYSDINPSPQGSTIAQNEWYDGRSDALFLADEDVVGIDKPKKELVELIMSMDNGLDVISVVGMGGLGKTTLLKKVYDDDSVKRHFNRHVWIVASDYADAKYLLTNLIRKLVGEIKEPEPRGLEGMSGDDMREFIYKFLDGKNYIIVLDDVWDINRWEVIRFALPRRGSHGCVIITTRYNSIANAASSETNHVYSLDPLPLEESKELFYRTAFPRNPCPPYLEEIAESILDRCEGLPLAIVVIGGLLATKNNMAEEWELFNRSLGEELRGGGRLQRISKFLSLSYYGLPHYLKYCLLYLSIFPEVSVPGKEKIIRLWVAEGFVQAKHGMTVQEVAESYLNELLSRSLIEVEDRTIDGRPISFRIHDLVREYISLRSREQDFAAICDEGELQWPTKIRRLVIRKFSNFNLSHETHNFKYLRSLLLLDDDMEFEQIKELLKKSRLVKVLDLNGIVLETIPHEVFKLYHLKYLSLRDTYVNLIPKSIKHLQNLETLDLKETGVIELPIEILNLHKLRHLLVYSNITGGRSSFLIDIQSARVPCDIGSCLPYLQKLCWIDADEVDGVRMVRELGKLTQLRKVGIAKLRREDGMELCSSIAKLTNLRSLGIYAAGEGEMLDLDGCHSLSSTNFSFLRTIRLRGGLEKVPRWVYSLVGLTKLTLNGCRIRENLLDCLEDLPNLAYLQIHDAYVEGLRFKQNGFGKLKELRLLCLKYLAWVMIEKGSMPLLGDLVMENCMLVTDLPQGIEHLSNLKTLEFLNMRDEFMEIGGDEERKGGDNRLDHVPNVYVYSTK